jgi:hypothetical protein
MDQTCLGRSGGFAPTIFPLFHGTRLASFSLKLGTSVMVTSSIDEAGHSQASNLLNLCPLADNWRRTLVQLGHREGRN